MKRLNPNTNQPFKRGETRKDGYKFLSYHYNNLKKMVFIWNLGLNLKFLKELQNNKKNVR